MKKRSLLAMVSSVVLVGALGAGATLAYFSAQTGPVTNTFTMKQDGIVLDLWEHGVVENSYMADNDVVVKAGEGNGNTYANLVPGLTFAKDPTVTVGAGSVKCAIFASVENANTALTHNMLPSWEQIGQVGNVTYYEYVGEDTTENDDYAIVDATAGDVNTAVFETVTVSANANATTTFEPIIIKAAAVQVEGSVDAKTGTVELREAEIVEAEGLEMLKKINQKLNG